MPRTAAIGPEVFERVTALMNDGATSKSEAFEVVAKERGMKVGTVSANFYRVSRLNKGSKSAPAARESQPTSSASDGNGRSRSPEPSVQEVVGDSQVALDAVARLAAKVTEQARELEQKTAVIAEQEQKLQGMRDLLQK